MKDKNDYSDYEISHPIFDIVKKFLKFKKENDIVDFLNINSNKIKEVIWEMKPLEENAHGIMQYRLFFKNSVMKCRVEKNSIYEPSSFSKEEAEILVSKMMNKFPNIQQDVKIHKIQVFENPVFVKRK